MAKTGFISGAEAVAQILKQEGVTLAVGYPGTSELALCEALDRVIGNYKNGRGDKEVAFISAGASLLDPATAVGVLHGARGLGNAAGAIADVRRNEVGTVYLVGLPSTASASFLPPHGEAGLIFSIGNFTKWFAEIEFPQEGEDELTAGHTFVETIRKAVRIAKTRPFGPTMVGLPQDVMEKAWIPSECITEAEVLEVAEPEIPQRVSDILLQSKKPLILIDDYLLKYPDARQKLNQFSFLIQAPVLQVKYRRGPMLFERLSQEDVKLFYGWYEPGDAIHAELMNEADLLITLEDRNMYQRVIGALPSCRKIAITSDAQKVQKNKYLTERDELLVGDVTAILDVLIEKMETYSDETDNRPHVEFVVKKTDEYALTLEAKAMREGIADALSDHFDTIEQPILIDDSQMFGGLLATQYDRFPRRLKVVGDHGGFVGGGMAFATGTAIAHPEAKVVCTVGDQGFGNAVQALVAAREHNAQITFIVCNNGESVSLKKQLGGTPFVWLDNQGLDYQAIAKAFGLQTFKIRWPYQEGETMQGVALQELRAALAACKEVEGPCFIELILPSLGDAWEGVWITDGFEKKQHVKA